MPELDQGSLDCVPLGESAVLVRVGTVVDEATAARVQALAAALQEPPLPGVVDVVPANATITVHFAGSSTARDAAPLPAAGRSFAERVRAIEARAAAVTGVVAVTAPERLVPVVYGGSFGPDLDHVAAVCKLAPADVIEAHAAGRYAVRAIGFTPGFPYLAGLPAALAVARRPSPRVAVPAGSVAIGGAQTGIYPIESPGGWQLIGRTPLALFEPARAPATLLSLGDRVRFEPINAATFRRRLRSVAEAAAAAAPAPSPSRPPARARRDPARRDSAHAEPLLEVLDAGPQSTLQDLGRPGLQRHGITPGGAVDPQALRLANRLLGNRDDAPCLEFALVGPQLRTLHALKIAVTGASVAGLAGGRPLEVAAGTRLDLRTVTRGARGYLAVVGGFTVERVLGGCGTDLRARFGGLGGRVLRAGDRLCGAAPPRARSRATSRAKGAAPPLAAPPLATPPDWFVDAAHLCGRDLRAPLRIVRGPQADWFSAETWGTLLARAFTVTVRSDRMGVRLDGPPLLLPEPRELLSEGVAAGTIQVPPDGQPIVLLADRQTIGGYPKIANVVAADLGRLAQRRPGDTVRFERIELEAAPPLADEEERAMAMLSVAMRLRGGK